MSEIKITKDELSDSLIEFINKAAQNNSKPSEEVKVIDKLVFNAEDKSLQGDGVVTTDIHASSGKSIQISTASQNFAKFEMDAKDIMLGKYAISIRSKTSHTLDTKEALTLNINLKRSNGDISPLRTIQFTNNDFESNSKYSWLTSWFDYGIPKQDGDKLQIIVKTIDSTYGIVSLDYIIINLIMAAHYSLA